MKFIKAEEFLKQDNEVQKVLLRWFNENISDYDLVQDENRIMLYKDYLKRECIENDSYPILTEGQIRRFIEDKTGCKVVPDLFGKEEYVIGLFYMGKNCFLDKADYGNLGTDLLQAYWKVAIQIIKEELK